MLAFANTHRHTYTHRGVFTQTLERKCCPTKKNALISVESKQVVQKSCKRPSLQSMYRPCFVYGKGCTLLEVCIVEFEGGSKACNRLQKSYSQLKAQPASLVDMLSLLLHTPKLMVAIYFWMGLQLYSMVS